MVVQGQTAPEQLQVRTLPSEASRAAYVGPEGGATCDDRPFLPVLREIIGESPDAPSWRIEGADDPDAVWIRCHPRQGMPPNQGWKLHVSAGLYSAETVMRQAIPVVLREGAHFKAAASSRKLASLNQGEFGPTQVGKFITIYPCDDAQALRLALALDEATRGLRGPAAPTDRALRAGSLVHYRYGAFGSRLMQLPSGEIVHTILGPGGASQPDRRVMGFTAPDWAANPFATLRLVDEPDPTCKLIGRRYMQLALLHQSPRGAVWLAVDIQEVRRCVLKQTYRDALLNHEGRDATDFTRHEAEILTLLAPDPRFPRMYDLLEDSGDLFLAIEDVSGGSLERHITEHFGAGATVPTAEIVRWGQVLAGTLGAMHERGLVHRDLKPSNVMISATGEPRLIDFEMAYGSAIAKPPMGKGTRGYISPRQDRLDSPEPADDIYSLGALLYFAATLADPSRSPDPFALPARPPALLNPAIDPALADIITRCLDPDPANRYRSMAEVAEALGAIAPTPRLAPATGEGVGIDSGLTAREREDYRRSARRLGDTLCQVARPLPNAPGSVWHSAHHFAGGIPARDLNSGTAGALLALAELVLVFNDREHRAMLAAGAEGLINASRFEGAPLAGLLVGESGVGAALLRVGQALGDSQLIDAAIRQSRWVSTLPFASPDFYNGAAGRVLFHLLLWDYTGDREHLVHARAAGDSLLSTMAVTDHGAVYWPFPEEYGGLGKGHYIGYAHGAAGIADSLLDLFEATGEERFATPAIRAAHWLAGQAAPTAGDESGLAWSGLVGETPTTPFWCHGAAGVGRLFLHAARLGLMPDAARIAEGAARSTARHARWANPTQCHGLSGNIEFLLDCYQTTRKEVWLTEARSLAKLLQAFAMERKGDLYYPSEFPHTFTPDYLVGFAGVAVCLLRLAQPRWRPRQLSREGFRLAQN
ncbi:MAG TPA: class IV lanthionine synthetase LanL [Chloroflexota bacterium]|nr:class IV lanthionine synthetase LanL [Chloroflexota bacterium]